MDSCFFVGSHSGGGAESLFHSRGCLRPGMESRTAGVARTAGQVRVGVWVCVCMRVCVCVCVCVCVRACVCV